MEYTLNAFIFYGVNMPEDIINEVKEEQEVPSDQVDSKTEQAFNLIRSHDEWMKKTQEFLDRNVNSL
jgi:hypothetical protein